jgi:hypothetical protein
MTHPNRRSFIHRSFAISTGLLIAATGLHAQDTQSTDQSTTAPGAFVRVAQKLDKGGTFYLIWDIGGAIRAALDSLGRAANLAGEPRAALGVPIVKSVATELGLANLGYLGISRAKDSDGRRQVVFLQAPEPKGLLTLGGEPRDLELLKYYPPETLALLATSLEFSRIIPIVESTARASTGAMGRQQVRDALRKVRERDGVDLELLLNSLGNEFSAGFWLDPEETIEVKGPRNNTAKIPRPRVAVALNTTSDTLFRLIITWHESNSNAGTVGTYQGWETLVGPESPDVPGIAPIIAYRPGATVFVESTSTLALITNSYSTRNDVQSSPEWKSMAAKLPVKRLKAVYVSPRSIRALSDAVQSAPAANRREREIRSRVADLIKWYGTGSLTITTYEDEGFLSVTVTEKN